MIKFLKSLFKSSPKETVESRIQQTTKSMIEEPVISFVKCLQTNPKRFKLKFHNREANDTGKWGELYGWMDQIGEHIGLASLTDKKDGSVYFGVVTKGSLYRVEGLNFSLNGWELKYLYEAFFEFRAASRKRKQNIENAKLRNWRKQKDIEEKTARMELMEKFK